MSGNSVDVVESFVYIGAEIHNTGSSEPEVRRRIGLAKSCCNLLNRGIMAFQYIILHKTSTILYLYPAILIAWVLTTALQDKVDAFDNIFAVSSASHIRIM